MDILQNNSDFAIGKKVLLIINPKAGFTTSPARAEHLISLLVRKGFDVSTYMTQYAKHSTRLALEHGEEYDILICVGGDGTLSEVVTGVTQLEKPPIIGYIPHGTTNDFAKTMKLPRTFESAVNMFARGKVRALDSGIFNEDERFVYVASFGAFTRVSYATPQDMKNMLGKSAYLFDGIMSLKDIRPYHARVKTDDGEYEDDFVFASVTNSTSVGGVMSLPKDKVDLSDGKYELLLIRNPQNIQQLTDTIYELMNGKYDNKKLIFAQSRRVEVDFDEATPFTTDGEYTGSFRHVTIENIKQSYKLLVP